MDTTNIAIIGCGKMGEAIVAGLCAASDEAHYRVTATARKESTCQRLRETYGIETHTDNAEAMSQAAVVILCVKPNMVRALLEGPGVREALKGKLLISICAGITLAQLAELAPEASTIRAMPNTPVLIREGMTVLAPRPDCTKADLEIATAVFSAVGRCLVLEEKHLDAVTGLSGSGPAFACVLLESMADGGVMMGLPRDVAVELAAQTMQGAARLVLNTGLHPAALKDQVTTPAGCTIAGLLTMEDGRIRSTLARAIQEAANVASGLGKSKL
jgi:pyrroline-5-carboxylate reductase